MTPLQRYLALRKQRAGKPRLSTSIVFPQPPQKIGSSSSPKGTDSRGISGGKGVGGISESGGLPTRFKPLELPLCGSDHEVAMRLDEDGLRVKFGESKWFAPPQDVVDEIWAMLARNIRNTL